MVFPSLPSHKPPFPNSQSGPGEDVQRSRIGAASENLKAEILKLYWSGVRDELKEILLSLNRWQTEPSYSETLPDEKLNKFNVMRGYEPFLTNVCHNPRSTGRFIGLPTDDRLRNTWSVGPKQKRALMLLQSTQFLDIDNLFGYRRPAVPFLFWTLPLWKRMSAPQLELKIADLRPLLSVRRCGHHKCQRPIRGSSYHLLQDETKVLCETCFRDPTKRTGKYRKRYKTCCLPSQRKKVAKLCSCYGKPHNWPLGIGDEGSCQLFTLNELIAEKKHKETSETIFESKSKEEAEALGTNESEDIYQPKRAAGETEKLQNPNSDSGHPPAFATSVGKSLSIEEVPLYLRYLRANYPFGNVHVALRFGPLIFENGISDTEGAVISTRALPKLQQSSAIDGPAPCLELTERDLDKESWTPKGFSTRTVYHQQRPRKDKRYKAMAKQVVGGAFSGLFDRETELNIANALVEEAGTSALDEMNRKEKDHRIEKSINLLFAKVQTYLSSRVEEYVDRIVQRLLDPNTALRWDLKENSCQTFCDKLIDTETFGPLLPPWNGIDSSPLYLMSFVCRSNDYIARGPGTTHGIPHGHVEEYLLKYRFGCHDDSDIMDTLQEYWYDWGNFEGVLYPYQDLFPWDCTQGFRKSPPHTCGSCNISEHVWAFPFDSHSLISLHLSRSRNFYPQGEKPASLEEDEGVMIDSEWFKNRLTLLTAQFSLLMGATAMVRNKAIQRAVSWLEKDETDDIDRIKLGGIVRAQPFSHRFEKDATGHRYHQYYVAGWTSLKLRDRKNEYEKLRNWRAEKGGGLDELKRLTRRRKWYSRNENGGGGGYNDGNGVGGVDGSADDGGGGDSFLSGLGISDWSGWEHISSGWDSFTNWNGWDGGSWGGFEGGGGGGGD